MLAAAVLLLAACGGDGSAGTSGGRAADGAHAGGTAMSPAATGTRAASGQAGSDQAASDEPGSDQPASGQAAADQPAVDPAAPGFPPTRSATVVSRRSFTSPTGNITCQLTRDDAACVIAEHDYPASDRPDGCAGRWLPLLEVGRSGPARLGPCEAGVLAPSGGPLAYGTTSVVGRMTCLSRLTGMTCWSGRSGHGFRLARAAYRLH